jgi:hypothetical protein
VAVERGEHALDVERERIAEQHHQLGAGAPALRGELERSSHGCHAWSTSRTG